MTHTPGPWKLDKSCDGFRTVSNGSLTICTVGESDIFPEIEHDAALIAAAPDMIDALRLCEELTLLALDHAHPRNSATISAIHKAAQAAIAKAEGRI